MKAMRHLTVRLPVFNELVKNYNLVGPGDDFQIFDEGESYRQLVALFNEVPGIVTTFSCASHPEQIDEEYNASTMYYAMAVIGEGLDNLFKIHELYTKITQQELTKVEDRVIDEEVIRGGFTLESGFSLTRTVIDNQGCDVASYYPTWILRFIVTGEDEKEFILECLHKALNTCLEGVEN